MKKRFMTWAALWTISSGVLALDLDNWVERNTSGTNNQRAIAFGNGVFVAVGENGDILTSGTGGHLWKRAVSATTNQLRGVGFGNGLFVAVGRNGAIVTSPDGYVWSSRVSGANARLTAVAYGNGRFLVADQDSALLLTSLNGVNWSAGQLQVSGQPVPVGHLAYGNGLFVGSGGTTVGRATNLVTSPDGQTWTRRAWPLTAQDAGAVAFGNGVFVAIGTGRAPDFLDAILSSSNAVNWTVRVSGITPNYPTRGGVAYGSNTFVVPLSPNGTISSADGITWTNRSAGGGDVGGIAFGDGSFVALEGIPFFGSEYLVSVCGREYVSPLDPWVSRDSGVMLSLNGIAHAQGKFVAVGDGQQSFDEIGNPVIVTSPDGINWEQQPSAGHGHLYSVAHGNGRFVAVGGRNLISGTPSGDALILTSTNGSNWVQRVSDVPANLRSVTFGNNLFVAAGEQQTDDIADPFGTARIVTSTDGVSWNARESGESNTLVAVTFGNGLFVAVSETFSGDGTILTSPNGVNWTPRAQPEPSISFSGVTYGNGHFVAVGFRRNPADFSLLLTTLISTDAINWSRQSYDLDVTCHGVYHVPGYFVMPLFPEGLPTGFAAAASDALDSGGAFWLVSTNDPTGLSVNYLFAAAGDGNSVVAVGYVGVILQAFPSAVGARPVLNALAPVAPNEFRFLINGEAGLNYRVQFAPQLPPVWQTRTNLVSTNAQHLFVAPVIGSTQGFFRVEVVP